MTWCRPARWALSALLSAGALFAQASGRISGRLIDSTGIPVADATVDLLLPAGSEPVATTRSDRSGRFAFASVRAEFYDLTATAAGFARQTLRNLKVDPAVETLLAPIRMSAGAFESAAPAEARSQPAAPSLTTVTVVEEQFRLGLGSTAAPLEISEQQQGPQTSNAEAAATFSREQVRGLPAIERDPMALLRTQAGVNRLAFATSRGGLVSTIVNGQRASYAGMTLDGVSIQPNYVRDNPLTSEFNRFFLDQVSEFTAVTSNASAVQPGASSQIVFVTPSGTNRGHGALYWYHRNQRLAAGDWIDNSRGFRQPGFAQNQFGATLQGPVKKDRLLLYGNYEGMRRRQRTPALRTLPSEEIRRGIFRYQPNGGAVRSVSLTQALGFQIHPEMQQVLAALPPASAINDLRRVGDSYFGTLLNTGGYSFPLRSNLDRDSALARADWIASERHAFSAAFNWSHDERDEPEFYTEGYASAPATTVANRRRFVSAAWRANPTAQFTNELRGGVHLLDVRLDSTESLGSRLLSFLPVPFSNDNPLFSNPVNPFIPERREDDVYSVQDNLSWIAGAHSIQGGFQYQRMRVNRFEQELARPTLHLGYGEGVISQLPGADAFDIYLANAWATTLAGLVNGTSGGYYLTAPQSGYRSGVPWERRLNFPLLSFYAQDNWRATRRLTLTLGLRYERFGVVNETQGLGLSPVLQGNVVQTLLGDPELNFIEPWYPRDNNNFAPQIGLAYDLFGNRRTVFRAAYSTYYVNDEHLRAAEATLEFNPGVLHTYDTSFGASPPFLDSVTLPAAPSFRIPSRLSEFVAVTPVTGIAMIDPNLRTPYVQQWSAGFQHDWRGTLFEIRYAGNHAVKGFRAVDLNQVSVGVPGYLEDFTQAIANGRAAQAATGIFDPRFNSQIAGSRPLPFLTSLPGSGLLSDASVQQAIRRGEAGELAAFYDNVYRIALGTQPARFFQNPLASAGAYWLAAQSHASFHSMQIEARRRLRSGLEWQANYVFSKVLTDSENNGPTRFEAYLDNANRRLARARAPYDLTHVVKGNFLYELPFARWKRNRLLEGWALSGIFIAHSGAPYSIVSGRGSRNQSGSLTGLASASITNTAITTLNASQLRELLRFHLTPFGPSIVPESITLADGRGATEPGEATFAGQVFFNPGPGAVGTLQQRMFTGPWLINLDASILKSTRIAGRHTLEIRFEARNVFNRPNWLVYDQNINEIVFGYQLGTLSNSERQLQAGMYYRF